MAKGKQTCKILKEIRKQIAAENDIELVVSECTYQGDCLGTCPKCEAEVRYLERELERRQRLGKAAVVAGLSVGLLGASQVAVAQQLDSLDVKPNHPEDVMITGIPAVVYYHVDTLDEVMELLVYPDMKNLSVVGFDLECLRGIKSSSTSFSTELRTKTKQFLAPQYTGGESALLEFISQNLGEDVDGNTCGDMEVAFTVGSDGRLSNIEIIKGVNEQLDAQVMALFRFMKWEPARWEWTSGKKIPFSCQCVQKLHFPITH